MPTVLVFVSPYCPTANTYLPEIKRIAERYVGRVRFVLVQSDPALKKADALKQAEMYGITLPVLLDPGQDVARRVGAKVTPEVVVGVALGRAPDAPGQGFHWGAEAPHPQLPRGERIRLGRQATLEEVLVGPSRNADGTTNIIGALRRAMATTGYSDVKEFQRVEVVVAPYVGR